mgnify:FL=1
MNEITTPGVEYVSALIIKANEVFSFYGDGIQIADANGEYERLKQEQAEYTSEKNRKKLGGIEKIALRTLPKFHLPGKTTAQNAADTTESVDDA